MSGIRLTNATLGTITLHDPSIGVYGQVRYVPTSPTPTPATQDDTRLDDGGEVAYVVLPNVQDTAEIYTDQLTLASLRTLFQNLGLMWEQARDYQRYKIGSPVYWEWRPDDSGAWLRSEVLYGADNGKDDLLDAWMLPAGKAYINLTFTRRYYFEGAEVYATLSNGNGTASTGVTVTNTNDSSNDHFVTITSTVAGDLPAPCRIEYTNNYSSGTNTANLLLALSARANPAAADMILETENMTSLVGSPTTQTGATYSNGSHKTWSWTGTSQQSLGYWTVSSALLSACQGQWYRVIARITAVSTLYQIRYNLKISNISPLIDGQWSSPSAVQNGLVDLGAVQLPPYLRGVTGTFNTLTLGLDVRGTSASAYTVPIDCIYLLPTESWRLVRQQGFGLAQNRRLLDDAMLDRTYTDDGSGSTVLGNYVPDGSPILLRPGVTNRLYCLVTPASGSNEIARSGSIRLAYRPRYRKV
jgi:hypothetical protein